MIWFLVLCPGSVWMWAVLSTFWSKLVHPGSQQESVSWLRKTLLDTGKSGGGGGEFVSGESQGIVGG